MKELISDHMVSIVYRKLLLIFALVTIDGENNLDKSLCSKEEEEDEEKK